MVQSVLAFGLGLRVVLVAGCGSSDPDETARARCAKMRDHLIEIRLQTAAATVDIAAHRKALEGAMGNQFIDACSELPAKQVTCTLAAKSSADVTACEDTNGGEL